MWTVSPYISGRKSVYGPYSSYLKAPCCVGRLGENPFWDRVPRNMNNVTLEIRSLQAIFSKWLYRPNHYAHQMCIETLSRTLVLKSKYLSPGRQNHMKNSKHSSLARMSISRAFHVFHIMFSLSSYDFHILVRYGICLCSIPDGCYNSSMVGHFQNKSDLELPQHTHGWNS